MITINKTKYSAGKIVQEVTDDVGYTHTEELTFPVAAKAQTHTLETIEQNRVYEFQININAFNSSGGSGFRFFSTFYTRTYPTDLAWTWIDTAHNFGKITPTSAKDLYEKLAAICNASGIGSIAVGPFVGRGNTISRYGNEHAGGFTVGIQYDAIEGHWQEIVCVPVDDEGTVIRTLPDYWFTPEGGEVVIRLRRVHYSS